MLAFVATAAPAWADPGGSNAGAATNMVAVGHNDLGGRGFNADVWVYKGYAYVGQWGFGDWANGSKDRLCPTGSNTSVLVIDARTPDNPKVVARLQNPPNTSAEDVVVYTARYGSFKGRDIAAAGIQWCGDSRYDTNAERGLMLWDVTNPSTPAQVGYLKTACCTRGVHEFEVEHRSDLGRTFAYATVPTSCYPDATTPSGYRDRNGDGDFHLIDITDPARPIPVADWGIQDIGGPFYAGQGCDADPKHRQHKRAGNRAENSDQRDPSARTNDAPSSRRRATPNAFSLPTVASVSTFVRAGIALAQSGTVAYSRNALRSPTR
jgi:hypothetical protein